MAEQMVDGRYHIVKKLGEGGMGAVYLAVDERLDREVALKRLHVAGVSPEQMEQFLQRFQREARSMARFSHPNITRLLDYGQDTDGVYLVLEYMPNGTLKDRIGKPMPAAKAAQLLKPIAEALAYVHARGMIHRDIKPANILFDSLGNPMLADFGIVKLVDQPGLTLTATGAGIGTPYYMAPEQMRRDFDGHVDQYALGIIFYELVTGKKPFEGETPMQTLFLQATAPLPDPRLYVADLAESACELLSIALAKRPQERYPAMEDFSRQLDVIIQNHGSTALPQSTAPAMPVAAQGSAVRPGEEPTRFQPKVQPLQSAVQPDSALVRQAAKPAVQPQSSALQAVLPDPHQSGVSQKLSSGVKRGLLWGGAGLLLLLLITAVIFILPPLLNSMAGPPTEGPSALALRLTDLAAEPTLTLTPTVKPVNNDPSTATPEPEATDEPTPLPTEVVTYSSISNVDLPYTSNVFQSNDIRLDFSVRFEQVFDVAFSPSGSLLAVNRKDGIYLVNMDTMTLRYRIVTEGFLHSGSLAFSADGSTLVTVLTSINKDVLVFWNVNSGKEIFSMELVTPTNSLAYSPDGTLLALGQNDKLLIMTMADKSIQEMDFEYAAKHINDLVFSPDGRKLAVAYRGGVDIFDTQSYTIDINLQGGYPVANSVDWSKDQSWLAFGFTGGTVIVYETDLWNERYNFIFDAPNYLPSAAFSPDSTLLAHTNDRDGLVITKVGSWVIRQTMPELGAIGGHALAWSSDGSMLAVAEDFTVYILPTAP